MSVSIDDKMVIYKADVIYLFARLLILSSSTAITVCQHGDKR